MPDGPSPLTPCQLTYTPPTNDGARVMKSVPVGVGVDPVRSVGLKINTRGVAPEPNDTAAPGVPSGWYIPATRAPVAPDPPSAVKLITGLARADAAPAVMRAEVLTTVTRFPSPAPPPNNNIDESLAVHAPT